MIHALRILAEMLYMILLSSAVIVEVEDDKGGDKNKTTDVIWRTVFCLISAALVYAFGLIGSPSHGFLQSFFMSGAIFFLVFDYAIAATRGRGDWFSYLGEKGVVDNIKFWRNMGPWW